MVHVWGPRGSQPRFGATDSVDAIRESCQWDTGSTRSVHAPEGFELTGTEFDYAETQVVYEANGVKITSFPVIHALSGAVGYRVDFAGLTFVHSGDTRAGWPLGRSASQRTRPPTKTGADVENGR